MLKFLHIENIAVIEKNDIDFSRGLNVLTGETGAGKSIVIDAINAVLGERTSKELIRSGCEKAEVSAIFSDISEHSVMLLQENGYDVDENGEIFVRRVLSLNGNGNLKINGKPATAVVWRSIGKSLVNIHGQHDNHGLLDPDTHYAYIDRLAENSDIYEKYYSEFKNLNRIRRELSSAETNEDEKQRQINLLKYQINELESANIKIGETKKLKQKLEIVQNYQKTFSSLNEALFYLSGSDDKDGALSLLKNSSKSISLLKGEKFGFINQKLNDISSLLEDVSVDIKDSISSLSDLELDEEKISQRLDLLYKLMLKYGESEEAMLHFYNTALNKLEAIELSEKRIAQLSNELDESTEKLIELAEELTFSRKKAATKFANEVTQALTMLDMPSVYFSVEIEKTRYSKLGCDFVQFLIKTNAGDEAKPLSKIASGGELSRVMLAIKSVLAKKDDIDTLIFDEIDTGISGRAAGKVGDRLYAVSTNRQVICVTHLAQIAAFADNHLLISKMTENGRTYTTVSTLNREERISEIARIMSGTDITENLYNSAKELLDRSTNNENL